MNRLNPHVVGDRQPSGFLAASVCHARPHSAHLLDHAGILCGSFFTRCFSDKIFEVTTPTDPAVLWRMTRGDATAHATIFPGGTQTTITWFFNDVMDRAENYESVELALARADEIRGVLIRDGWIPADRPV